MSEYATPDRVHDGTCYFSGTVSTGTRRGTYTSMPAGWYTAIKKVEAGWGTVTTYRWTRS